MLVSINLIYQKTSVMVDMETARQMALALPGVYEQDHFGRPSFRANKKIFSTLWTHENKMMVKLPVIQQSIFYSFNPAVFYPVPNKWGEGGAPRWLSWQKCPLRCCRMR
jgi:hypothetical protein